MFLCQQKYLKYGLKNQNFILSHYNTSHKHSRMTIIHSVLLAELANIDFLLCPVLALGLYFQIMVSVTEL